LLVVEKIVIAGDDCRRAPCERSCDNRRIVGITDRDVDLNAGEKRGEEYEDRLRLSLID